MNPDELRALADALEPMSGAPRFDCLPVVEFCAWLRQCADAKPVAWRVECRWTDRSKGGDWRKYADYGTEQAATSSQQVFANPGDIESRVVPLYAAPVPQQDFNVWKQIIPEDAPQAEPSQLAGQEISLGALMREQRQSRIVAGAYPDGNPNAGAMMAQTPQAEPKRKLSDDEISKLAWKQNIWTDGMIEFSFLAFAREIENAHGIGGSDAE